MNEQEQSVVEINENALDKECIKLPTDYLKYAHRAIDKKRDVDEAKAAMEVVELDMSKKVRASPAVYGLEKTTEAAITEVVRSSTPYRNAVKDFNDARYEADMAQAVVSALEHKKRTLTLLVDLHGMSYFSKPKVTEEGRNAVEHMTQRARPGNVKRKDWADKEE